jgi:hypothetical protein
MDPEQDGLTPELQAQVDHAHDVASDLDIPDEEAEAVVEKLMDDLSDHPQAARIIAAVQGSMEMRMMVQHEKENDDYEGEGNFPLTEEGDAAFLDSVGEGEQKHPLTPEGDAAFFASLKVAPDEVDRGADREGGDGDPIYIDDVENADWRNGL